MIAGVRNRMVPHHDTTNSTLNFDFVGYEGVSSVTPVEVAASLCLLVGIIQVKKKFL